MPAASAGVKNNLSPFTNTAGILLLFYAKKNESLEMSGAVHDKSDSFAKSTDISAEYLNRKIYASRKLYQ